MITSINTIVAKACRFAYCFSFFPNRALSLFDKEALTTGGSWMAECTLSGNVHLVVQVIFED